MKKSYFIKFFLIIIVFTSCQFNRTGDKWEPQDSPNVLFVIVDDLNTELGCYGNKLVQSPNIDRIAKTGVVFNRVYSQFPICGPSRCSFLTGLRPTRKRFTSNRSMVDEEVPQYSTLPEFFKQNGYYTISNGKVFHDHGNIIDGMDGWSEIPWEPHPGFWVWEDPDNRKYTYKGYKYRKDYQNNPGPSREAPQVEDDAYPTGVITNKTIQDLQRLVKMDKPFFLAVGYRKPHLPLNAPKKYWDLYNREQFKLADNFKNFNNIPKEAFHNSRELRVYNDIPDKGEINKETWIDLIHGYYACISYTDEQVGILIDEIERLGLKEETIVVLIGDHGYQLTDHGMWSKGTNFHEAIHSPLIVSVPGLKESRQTSELLEFVDIYPSLAELCGLNVPNHIQGMSFAPIIKGNFKDYNSKKAAFSRVGDGETIISEKYIYTEWINEDGLAYEKMLFDLKDDPMETNNLAGLKKYQHIENNLSEMLHEKIYEINNKPRNLDKD
jgi:iduronate 2-sulfatase